MPGRDGTGPMAEGAKTGRGLGNCPEPTDAPAKQAGVAQGYGQGRGLGRGLGRGQGRGFGRWNFSSSEEELSSLKQQAQAMQEVLSNISDRIEELEKK